MQADPLFWHRTLDRRTGVLIPFPGPRRPAFDGMRMIGVTSLVAWVPVAGLIWLVLG